MIGLVILKNPKKQEKKILNIGNIYGGGTIMDPNNGEINQSKAWVKGDLLTSRGYVVTICSTKSF